MSQNPFQPSNISPNLEPTGEKREYLRSVALYQKGILVCILIYLLALAGQFFIPPEMRIFLGLGVLLLGLVGSVFVFLLAIRLNGPVLGIVYGVLSMIPCLGLIILLVVNGHATAILKENRIAVGLMGADLSKI